MTDRVDQPVAGKSDRPANRPLPGRRLWAFRLVAVLLSLLGCFLVLEVVLRFIDPEYYRFSASSPGFYTNPRNYFNLIGNEDGRPVYGIDHETATPPGGDTRRVPDEITSLADTQAFC